MVKVLSADFLTDSDFIGKQDPYITFEFNKEIKRTKTHDNAGK
jgi:Ca2+-dependent lipid-binding protein